MVFQLTCQGMALQVHDSNWQQKSPNINLLLYWIKRRKADKWYLETFLQNGGDSLDGRGGSTPRATGAMARGAKQFLPYILARCVIYPNT